VERAHTRVVHRRESVGQDASEIAGERVGVLAFEQPPAQRARRAEGGDALDHGGGGKEVVLDELGQAVRDARLVARQDGSVRDEAQVERVMEQGDDGEPVGDGADHRRLGGACHVVQPRVARLQGGGEDIDDAGGGEQAGCDDLHALESGHGGRW
jgi:hypothetical protein